MTQMNLICNSHKGNWKEHLELSKVVNVKLYRKTSNDQNRVAG